MSRFKRLITLILAVLFLNISIPMEVLAETFNGGNKATQADPHAKEKESKKEALILQEIKEKRTSNTKYFLKDDHSYEVAIYPNDIHYYEDGQWKDIDNSLEEAIDIEQDVSGKEVKQQTSGNKGNDFKVIGAGIVGEVIKNELLS